MAFKTNKSSLFEAGACQMLLEDDRLVSWVVMSHRRKPGLDSRTVGMSYPARAVQNLQKMMSGVVASPIASLIQLVCTRNGGAGQWGNQKARNLTSCSKLQIYRRALRTCS